jgi:hypothetical protein
MNLQDNPIDKLLHLYFNGHSSIDEEARLKEYFRNDTIAPEHLPYRPLFAHWAEEAAIACPQPEAIPGMVEALHRRRNRKSRAIKWASVASVAALLAGFVIWISLNSRQPAPDLKPAPDLASTLESYRTAMIIITDVSEKMNKGLKPMATLANINTGLEVMQTLEKSMEPLQLRQPAEPAGNNL